MAEAERLFLVRVADLHHVGDVAHHLGLLFFAVLLEKSFEKWRSVEVIFDGAFSAAGDDDDVLDAGSHALFGRSEEHTSELQSHSDLVCRLLLEKKKRQWTS